VTLPLPIDHARRAVLGAYFHELRRRDRKYRRRRTLHRLDDALELVELANLAGATTPPAAALELVAELAPGLPLPDTALKTHAALFAIQRRYMRTVVLDEDPADHEDDDLVVALAVLDGAAG
jgi:hypothetical protein